MAREILAKSYVGSPPGGLAPTSGKSWIRHWSVSHSVHRVEAGVHAWSHVLLGDSCLVPVPFRGGWTRGGRYTSGWIYSGGSRIPRGGGANSPTYDFAKFSPKLHGI